MTLAEVYRLLNQAVKESGSQRAFAEKCGVSATYLHDVLNARREPGGKILEVLGVRRVVRYEVVE